MGKRSNFERNPRDYYKTPYEGVLPLLRHISQKNGPVKFIEPCAGDGRLIRHLEKNGLKCVYASDIHPDDEGLHDIQKRDVLFFGGCEFPVSTDLIITNPPWERSMDGTGPLHDMITAFRQVAPTWLLFDSDWMFTDQAKPFLRYCHKIVSVGRLSWMDNGVSGMDNCCWYLFDKTKGKRLFFP